MLTAQQVVDEFQKYYAPGIVIMAPNSTQITITTLDGVSLLLNLQAPVPCRNEDGTVFTAAQVNADAFQVASTLQVEGILGSGETYGIINSLTYVKTLKCPPPVTLAYKGRIDMSAAYTSAVIMAAMAHETGILLNRSYGAPPIAVLIPKNR